MALKAIDLKPKIGSELKVDAKTLLDGSHKQEIRQLLVQRGVIIGRGIDLNDDQQRSFTRSLGDLRLGTVRKEGEEGLMKVTMDKKVNPEYAEFFPGTFFWHMDGTYEEMPPFATLFTPRVLSPEGGQTEFANTYAAYEDLPEDEKAWLETLQVVHTMQAAMFPAMRDARRKNSRSGTAIRSARTRWSGTTSRAASRWCSAPRLRTSSACTRPKATTCCSG